MRCTPSWPSIGSAQNVDDVNLRRLPLLAQMRSARCPLLGLYQRKSGRRGHHVFVDAEVIRGGPLLEVAWRAR
jgi:hypothetical protein